MINVLSTLILFALLRGVDGHGMMTKPASRNAVAWQSGTNYCPHCLNAGGVAAVSSKLAEFPSASPESPSTAFRHGLCGDPSSVSDSAATPDFKEGFLQPGTIQGHYHTAGGIEIEMEITANHAGYFEFYLCDQPSELLESPQRGQECLNKHRLLRAAPGPDDTPIDTTYPWRWYLPKTDFGDGSDGAVLQDGNYDEQIAGSGLAAPRLMVDSQHFTLKYHLPADLECEHCVLQWYWRSANSCNPSGLQEFLQAIGKADWARTRSMGTCGAGGGYPEEFWNCADISVTRQDGATPPLTSPTPIATLVPSQVPTPFPTSQPTFTGLDPEPSPTPEPEPEPQPEPVPSSECSAVWDQCGGQAWDGAACCEEGSKCVHQGQWYSQCQPIADWTSPGTNCQTNWNQCGGQNWDGPTCCNSGWDCEVVNVWYHQCRKSESRRQLRGRHNK